MILSGARVSTSAEYEASRVVKATGGILYQLYGYSSKDEMQFIQVHNAASLPADTSVPSILIGVAAMSNFSIDLGEIGENLGEGIIVCNSSTGPTKTIGAADCWFRVVYR